MKVKVYPSVVCLNSFLEQIFSSVRLMKRHGDLSIGVTLIEMAMDLCAYIKSPIGNGAQNCLKMIYFITVGGDTGRMCSVDMPVMY